MNKMSILLVEDNPDDSFFFQEMLCELAESSHAFSYDCILKETLKDAEKYLKRCHQKPDTILLDLHLPDSWGLDSIERILLITKDIPIVVLTGLDDQDTALQSLKRGAQDYLVKGHFSSEMLLKSLRYSIERFGILREKQSLIEELSQALDNIRRLQGLLPICSSCKKIRHDSGYWKQVEDYLTEHSGVRFTHSMCPDCLERVMLEIEKDGQKY